MKASGASPIELWNTELKLLSAEDTLGFLLQEDKGRRLALRDDKLAAEIQVTGIGDNRSVGIQFVIELANGRLPGYAATARAYAEAGYEAETSLLTGRSGDQLAEAAAELLYKSKR